MDELFLGIDCSTQAIKATVVDNNLNQVYEQTVNYDSEFPQYGTERGAIKGSDGLTFTTPTLLWVEALQRLFEKMKHDNFQFQSVKAVSGSGQQHGRLEILCVLLDLIKYAAFIGKEDPRKDLHR
jgi:xylulokinase